MTLREIVALLDARVIPEDSDLDREVTKAFGADLMSDVLYLAQPGSILLTGLVNPQVVRTAEMADITAIAIVRGKEPPAETVQLAAEKRIPLILSPYTLFECCGRLYSAGLAACEVQRSSR